MIANHRYREGKDRDPPDGAGEKKGEKTKDEEKTTRMIRAISMFIYFNRKF